MPNLPKDPEQITDEIDQASAKWYEDHANELPSVAMVDLVFVQLEEGPVVAVEKVVWENIQKTLEEINPRKDNPMISFLDGPAQGHPLQCSRAPYFLRVTCLGDVWDALDQLDDRPKPKEAIWVYKKAEDQGWVHLDYTDKNGRRRGRTEQVSTYKLCDEQPSDDVMRDQKKWVEWAQEKYNAKGK